MVAVEAAAGDGSKVAGKGACIGLGRITGMSSADMAAMDAPNSTWMAPVACITWLAPGWSVPVHTVLPDETSVASTQHVPSAVMVTS